MELKSKAITGVKWVTVATVVNTVLQLLLIMILARYVSKTEFGLMALVQVVIEFSNYFIDMGFSNIIIHKQDINANQLSSLYWLNIMAGIIIFVIIYFVSPFLSVFYNEPGLAPLLNIVALTFLIIPFGQQHKTLMQKELKFDTMSKIDVLSRVISIGLAITAGIMGYGIYALVLQVLANSIISTGLFLYAGLKNHRPRFVFSHKELKGMYSFGAYQLGERTLNYFSGQFDTIIIGKLLGAAPLGVYTIAKNLVMRPQQIINPIVTRVAFPALAKVQEDTQLLRRAYINTMNYLSSINFPVHLGMLILAEPLTLILFGPKWEQAIVLIRILSVFAMIRSVYSAVGPLILAKGRADLGFFWNVFFSVITIPTIFIGGLLGLTGVCYAQAVLMVLIFYPFYRILITKLINAGFWEYHRSLVLPLILSLCACIVPFMAEMLIPGQILKIAAVLVTGTAIYFLLSVKYNKEFINLMKNFVRI